MKYLLPSLTALMLAVLCISCKPSAEQIMQNADSLKNMYKSVVDAHQVLAQTYETYIAADMDAAHKTLDENLKKASAAIAKIEVLEGCENLASAVKAGLEVYKTVADVDSKEQIRIYKIDDANFTDELREKWDGIARSVETKTKQADAEVDKAYSEVAKQFSNKK